VSKITESSQIETLEIGLIFAVLLSTANEYACRWWTYLPTQSAPNATCERMIFCPETIIDILSRFSSLSDFAIVIDNISWNLCIQLFAFYSDNLLLTFQHIFIIRIEQLLMLY